MTHPQWLPLAVAAASQSTTSICPPRAQLESAGEPLAEPDLRIASIALARGLTLVTANTRHFDRVPELRVENWLA